MAKKNSKSFKPATSKKETSIQKIDPALLEKMRIQDEKKHQDTILGRQIRDDFIKLQNSGRAEISEIADFVASYSSNIEVMSQILSPYKRSKDFHSQMVWRYLLGEKSEELSREIVLQKMRQERTALVRSIIPNLLIVKVPTTGQGPKLEFISKEYLTNLIREKLKGHSDFLEITITNFLIRAGKYPIKLLMDDGIEIGLEVEFIFDQEPLSLEIAQRLSTANDLITNRGDVEFANILKFLQNTLDVEMQSEISNYYPLMGDVLKTAYQYGFWRSPWIQGVFHEWKSKHNEYILNSEIELIRAKIRNLNKENWIPDEYDNDDLDKTNIEKITKRLLDSDATLCSKELRVSFDEIYIDDELVSVNVFLVDLPVGKVLLQRVASFLPSNVRDEFKKIDMENLVRLKTAGPGQLLNFADQETKYGSELRDENNRPDYSARSRYLAGICRILLERGKVDSVQFKRTLTHYYAAKGPDMLDENPINARFYFLMFYRMMYKEGLTEHLKAMKPLDYPVLANLVSTYLSPRARAKTPQPAEIKSHPELTSQFPLLWRLAQLLAESPTQFLSALFDMFQIEEGFVRNLLKNLRMIHRIDIYELGELKTESNVLLKYLVSFTLSDPANPRSSKDLMKFIIVVLDCNEIVKQIENDFQKLLGAANRFANAKDAVQKSTLYTEVDRVLLQCREAVDRLARQMRLYPESAKKAGVVSRFLNELKNFINDVHHEFFKNAALEAQLDITTLPKGRPSPIDIKIKNTEAGLATNVHIRLDRNSSFDAENYDIPISPFYAKEERIATIFITPLADLAVEISGHISFEDQEVAETQKEKKYAFRQTFSVSDPKTFKKFVNPYITGRAIQDTNMFFGRRTEIEEIIRSLRGGTQDRILAIHGERRIGKTSLIFQIKDGDSSILNIDGLENIQKDYLSIYITFERFEGFKPEDGTWLIYFHIYSETYNASFDFHSAPKVDIVSFPHDNTSVYFVENFLTNLIKRAGTDGKKLLFLFDEFDTLIHIGGEERGFFGFLRELIMKYGKEASFIFVGQSTLVEMMKLKANRLYSLANTKEILRLTDDEARALIIDPISKVEPDFQWAEGAVRQLLYYTEGNPYFIQTLCFHIVEYLVEGKRLRATVNDVEKAVHSAIEGSGELSIALADKIQDSELNNNANIILVIVAMLTKDEVFSQSWVSANSIEQKLSETTNKVSLEITNKFPLYAIPRLLDTLVSKGILCTNKREEEQVTAYTFQLPLLRLYVMENLNLKDLLREGGYLK